MKILESWKSKDEFWLGITMTSLDNVWKLDAFNGELKSLGRLKGDEFEEAFACFIFNEYCEDEVIRNEATFHFFMTNSTLKNMLYVARYFNINYTNHATVLVMVKDHIKKHGAYLRAAEVIIELDLQANFTFVSNLPNFRSYFWY